MENNFTLCKFLMALIHIIFFIFFYFGVKYVSEMFLCFCEIHPYSIAHKVSDFMRTSFLSNNTSNTNAQSTRLSERSKTSPRDHSHHLKLDLTCSFIITNSGHHTNHFITPTVHLPAHTPALCDSCHVYILRDCLAAVMFTPTTSD